MMTLCLTANLKESGDGELRIRLDFSSQRGQPAKVECSLELAPANFKGAQIPLPKNASELLPGPSIHEFTVPVPSPEPWNTWDRGHPNLYQVKVALQIPGQPAESATFLTGFRRVAVSEDGKWSLNGQRFFPRGTHFNPVESDSEYGPDLLQRDIGLLRGAGINAIRLTGRGARQEILDACDQAGILVWHEFMPGSEEPSEARGEGSCKSQAQVRSSAHHPCIALWGGWFDPETLQEGPAGPAFFLPSGEEDPSRNTSINLPSPHSVFSGWQSGTMQDLAEFSGGPLVGAFGAQALPGSDTLMDILPERPSAWPPRWDEWTALGFQKDSALKVAGIPLGESLDEFIGASQAYQAELLKTAIEHFRVNRDRGIEGFFHYTFVDSQPAIGFSVIDFARRPKLGYSALALACQPVLPVFQFQDHQSHSGARVHATITVVNDRLEPLEDANAEITLEVERGTLITWSARVRPVPALGVIQDALAEITDDFRLPSNMTTGPARISIRLLDSAGRRLAENFDQMEVISPPNGVAPSSPR